MTEACRITGFPPVFAPGARVLILGSMPSVESLRHSFYYAHPRNAFWPILAAALNEPMPETVAQKKEMLLRHDIALWDSVGVCVREGSLDSDIRDPEINDFGALYAACPRIHTILFNGAAAQRLYERAIGKSDGKRHIRMPSTSPAYTLKPEQKRLIWQRAIEEALAYEPL